MRDETWLDWLGMAFSACGWIFFLGVICWRLIVKLSFMKDELLLVVSWIVVGLNFVEYVFELVDVFVYIATLGLFGWQYFKGRGVMGN